jgi:hypothetical protein
MLETISCGPSGDSLSDIIFGHMDARDSMHNFSWFMKKFPDTGFAIQ